MHDYHVTEREREVLSIPLTNGKGLTTVNVVSMKGTYWRHISLRYIYVAVTVGGVQATPKGYVLHLPSQTVSNREGINGSMVIGRERETKSQLPQGSHLHINQVVGTYTTSAPIVESEAGQVT
jgi:hypothetical protein